MELGGPRLNHAWLHPMSKVGVASKDLPRQAMGNARCLSGNGGWQQIVVVCSSKIVGLTDAPCSNWLWRWLRSSQNALVEAEWWLTLSRMIVGLRTLLALYLCQSSFNMCRFGKRCRGYNLLKIMKTHSFGSGPTINNTRLLQHTKLSSSVSPRSQVPKSFARCRPTELQVLYLPGSDGSLLDFSTAPCHHL
jgi:hypothetical protein